MKNTFQMIKDLNEKISSMQEILDNNTNSLDNVTAALTKLDLKVDAEAVKINTAIQKAGDLGN